MEEEYKIEVLVTPHYHDNLKNPYFWCVLRWYNEGWCNTSGSGWAASPEEAFNKANKWYEYYYKK